MRRKVLHFIHGSEGMLCYIFATNILYIMRKHLHSCFLVGETIKEEEHLFFGQEVQHMYPLHENPSCCCATIHNR